MVACWPSRMPCSQTRVAVSVGQLERHFGEPRCLLCGKGLARIKPRAPLILFGVVKVQKAREIAQKRWVGGAKIWEDISSQPTPPSRSPKNTQRKPIESTRDKPTFVLLRFDDETVVDEFLAIAEVVWVLPHGGSLKLHCVRVLHEVARFGWQPGAKRTNWDSQRKARSAAQPGQGSQEHLSNT